MSNEAKPYYLTDNQLLIVIQCLDEVQGKFSRKIANLLEEQKRNYEKEKGKDV